MAVGNVSSRISNADPSWRGWRVRLALACAAVPMAVALSAEPGPSAERLLTERMGFSADDVRELERGSAVT
ncbi:MAG: hypothetical protein F4018_05355, partial [Acidobacteria bacterium]|nr:hypothetical protein [Acidobacteriota bacterium]